MTFPDGYTFLKVRTSRGPQIYVSQFGELVRVMPCDSDVKLSEGYARDLIQEIESSN